MSGLGQRVPELWAQMMSEEAAREEEDRRRRRIALANLKKTEEEEEEKGGARKELDVQFHIPEQNLYSELSDGRAEGRRRRGRKV